LIEFALVFPLLLLVLFGILDYGLMFQRYETVTNAAREGARVAVLPGYAQADVQARVTQYLAAAGLTATPTLAYTAPQAVNIGGACVTITGVTVGYPHQFIVIGKIITLFGGAGFTSRTLTATARMRYEGAAIACAP
jgi:Flp pilus assembly protein TadG